MNSAVIISLRDLETCLSSIQRFNLEYNLPLVIFANKDKESDFKITAEFLFHHKSNVVDLSDNFKADLDLVTNTTDYNISLLLVEEGAFV